MGWLPRRLLLPWPIISVMALTGVPLDENDAAVAGVPGAGLDSCGGGARGLLLSWAKVETEPA